MLNYVAFEYCILFIVFLCILLYSILLYTIYCIFESFCILLYSIVQSLVFRFIPILLVLVLYYWKIWYDVLWYLICSPLVAFLSIGKVGEFYEHKTCTRTFSVLRVRVVPVELSFEKVLLFFCPGNLFCLVFASRKKSLAKKPRKQEDTSTTWNT